MLDQNIFNKYETLGQYPLEDFVYGLRTYLLLRYVCRNYCQFELIISNYLLEYKILARKRPLGRYDGQLR